MSYIQETLAAATQWLFNLVIARSVPNMLVTMGAGGYGAFFLFARFCIGMFVFVWFLVPETKGMSLEKMDDLFWCHRASQTDRG